MADNDIALMGHLMRRAGFGAPREELEARVARGYEATVEELLHPEDYQLADEYLLARYSPHAGVQPGENAPGGTIWYMWHMINTERPLGEKMTLFWHQLFATSMAKVGNYDEIAAQITLFRDLALGDFKGMLNAVAKNPAMIYWLDNQENHNYAVNENWGRELLELFSMGVGNYTEVDVREASRAFTGWALEAKVPVYTNTRYLWDFEYKVEEHDYEEKSFLGHQGRFNGEDIIDIIVEQPACARFIARHLYNFFVADESQVPSWNVNPPRDEGAVQTLARAFTESKGEIRSVLRVLFNSEFFKEARFARVKSPVELVVGVQRLVGGYDFPTPYMGQWSMQPTYMGQDIMKPPSVEGWHTGKEWIDSGSLMTRINFASELVGDLKRPGVQDIVGRVRERGTLGPEKLVEVCLDLIGPIEVRSETQEELMEHAREGGDVKWDTEEEAGASARRVVDMLQLIVSTKDYQFG